MYECTICLTSNHSSRLHCSYCGAVPAMYSLRGVTGHYEFPDDWSTKFIPIAAAHGVYRASSHHAQRINLKTVPLDYYGE